MSDPLARYNAKRDFRRTEEPAGKKGRASGNGFIVQKHDATRLHWDFRLEQDGVLKSWAVTRGPSLDPADKRLAVRTEDHPLSYATFEGTIPAGEYGGGTVMLWDRGQWFPIGGSIEKGHLHFRLEGERMKGEWLLVRMKGRPKERNENWLLRKVEDAYAGGADELVEHALTSVDTGRTMQDIAEGRTARKRAARRLPMPEFRPVQLATLVDTVPPGNQWIHEVKYDGYRGLIAVGGRRARFFTRSGLDWSDRFPEIVAAAATLPASSALIDGEVVALDVEGRPNFSRLQAAIEEASGTLVYFAFDLLALDGEDIARLPNIERKERLRALLPAPVGPIHYADHVSGSGEKLFDAMCAAKYEGIVSKRASAAYVGRRTTSWVKVKCLNRQEFVIIGWTKSSTRARPFASLLLAQDGRYAGRVGTGFSARTLDMLAEKFARRKRDKPPVEVPRAMQRGVQWIEPDLVAEIAFAEFTADNVVRHASFIGLREDKPAETVRQERAMKISNADRVLFPEAGITKGQLADYYQAIAEAMLPWVADRPISLVRCPQGRAKQCFFQKHDAGSFGEKVRHVDVREKDGSVEPYLYISDAAGLLTCVQMGTIEFHGWGSRVDDIERPDRMVFDLDPDTAVDFEAVKKAARDLKRHLSDLGLVSFPLLSGGKGLHVVVPLTPGAEWPAVKDFSHRFALALAEAEPDRFTAALSKARRKGRIFIDYLRNQRGATAIMPYSVRARTGAPVSMPVAWSELDEIKAANLFTLDDLDAVLKRRSGRALRGWGIADQMLPDR